jgi:hypothetical protein
VRNVALAFAVLLLLAIAAEPAGADDGIPVRGPANGTTFPTSSTIVLEIDEPWFDPQAAGTFRLRVATDPALTQTVYTRSGGCPAGPQPTCRLLDAIGPLPAGTYSWGLEVDFPDQPQHLSDVWAFTVAPPIPSTAPLVITDPIGDARGAPDISQVEVTTDGTDELQFQITIPGLRRLAPDERAYLLLDVDQRAGTGNFRDLGSEYRFSLTGSSDGPSIYRFQRWDRQSGKWVSALSKTTRATYSTGVLFVLRLPDIGGPTPGLNFWAESDKGTGDATVFDLVPGASMANYQLPASATHPRADRAVIAFPIQTNPTPPRAGKALRVSIPTVILGNGEQADAELVECSATIVGRRVRSSSGDGRCTVLIPPRTAGKVLRLTVTVYVGAESKSRTVALRIRR